MDGWDVRHLIIRLDVQLDFLACEGADSVVHAGKLAKNNRGGTLREIGRGEEVELLDIHVFCMPCNLQVLREGR